MVEHIQIIGRQQPTNFLSMFDHFVGLVLKGLNSDHGNIQFKMEIDQDNEIPFYDALLVRNLETVQLFIVK